MQPLTNPSPTIRYADGRWSIDLYANDRTIRVSAYDVQIHHADKIEILPWGELVDLITELADVDENEPIRPVVFDPLAWLLARPGVVRAPQTNGRHGFLPRDDYDDTATYTA